MLSEPVIKLNNIWKKYLMYDPFNRSLRDDLCAIIGIGKVSSNATEKEFWALKNIDLSVKRGECIALYGPNGAGKSTILKLIANVTYPSKGVSEINGKVAPIIDIIAGFHPDLTGRENIYVNGAIIGMKLSEIKNRMEDIIAYSGLGTFIDVPVKKYSSGMYLRLGFSIAIHSTADIILIDEVISVGDEDFQNKCITTIKNLRGKKTMLLVSHFKPLLMRIVDRIVYIENGEIINEEIVNVPNLVETDC